MAELLYHCLVEHIRQALGPFAEDKGTLNKQEGCVYCRKVVLTKWILPLTVQRLEMVQDWLLLFSSPPPPKQPCMCSGLHPLTFSKKKGHCCPSYLKLSVKVPSLSQPLKINTLEEIQLSFSRSHHSQDFKLFTPKYWVAKEQSIDNPLHEVLQWPTYHKNSESNNHRAIGKTLRVWNKLPSERPPSSPPLSFLVWP